MTKDQRFIESARALAAIWSKDPSTKVCCIAVGDRPNLVAFGYNGLPPGLADSDDRLLDRPTRLALTLHAETNALYNATFEVRTLYVTHHPCAECALDILAARTVRRVVYQRQGDFDDRWSHSLAFAADLLAEGGIELVPIDNL